MSVPEYISDLEDEIAVMRSRVKASRLAGQKADTPKVADIHFERARLETEEGIRLKAELNRLKAEHMGETV